ncbi:hypothetical protein [Pseudomonas sp. Irchel s3f10]|uniref:hypothetical protein n=1 Tax=Pseudomonas sp. Irchel s3f10 TaxID=2009137 RepID=UPI00113FE873|nr:hypothetical protein [Pseudomonas sp. Irchel s3f10]
MKTSTTPSTCTTETSTETTVIKLREGGMSIANIMKETGLPERQVKRLTAHIAKPPNKQKAVTKIPTPLVRATELVFTLASRPCGIRDYELRHIMHEEYGSTWDTSTGRYNSDYDSDKLKRVRAKVRERAITEECDIIFTMDWISEEDPRASSQYLLSAADGLVSRINEHVAEYMALHATRWNEDSDEARLAQVKQRYAVERYLLKLAVKNYGKEPIDKLLERTATLVDELEKTPDAPLSKSGQNYGGSYAKEDKQDYYPEPPRRDAFLEFVESQGWIKEVANRFI